MECLNQFLDYFWTENVRPLQNKTGKEVVEGFKQILQKGRKCKKTENGQR